MGRASATNRLRSTGALLVVLAGLSDASQARQFDKAVVYEPNSQESFANARAVISSASHLDWIIIASRSRAHTSEDGGATWSDQATISGSLTPDIALAGDSLAFVVSGGGVLYRVVRGAPFEGIDGGFGGRVHSVEFMSSGVLVVAGEDRVFRSEDLGRTWTTSTNDLYLGDAISTKSAVVRQISESGLVAFAQTAIVEPNIYRLFYSRDAGDTWADSTENATWLREVVSTPTHPELHFGAFQHRARRGQDGRLHAFESSFELFDVSYSERWGVVAAAREGVYTLDETDLTWRLLDEEPYATVIAAGYEGKLLVGDPIRGVFELWLPTATSVMKPDNPTELNIYPNPASTRAIVSGVSPGSMVRVFDILGREVSAGFAPMNGSPVEMELSGLPAGQFFLVVDSGRRVSAAGLTIAK